MADDYVALMDQLRDGSLAELRVKPDQFMAFRAAWNNYPERKEIVGTAEHGGDIVYHAEGDK